MHTDKEVTREQLYELVWEKPMLRVAEQFGVSSSYMARVCSQLHVPRPDRGYWAKLEVGKAPAKPALPATPPGVPASWSPGTALDVPISQSIRSAGSPKRGAGGEQLHSLLRGVREHFAKAPNTRECGYLKPAKWTLPDLTVTAATLDRAIELADTLYKELEKAGASVVLDGANRPDFGELEDGSHVAYNNLWVPRRGSVAYFGEVAIGFAIGELSEVVDARYINGKYVREDSAEAEKARKSRYGHSWTSKQPFATGRLFVIAYAASRYANWQHRWNEKAAGDLADKVPSICRSAKRAVSEIAAMIAAGKEQARIEQERWEAQRREYDARLERERREKARQDSRAQLFQIFKRWNEAAQMRQFLAELDAAQSEVSEEHRSGYARRLAEARSILPEVDLAKTLMTWNPPSAFEDTR
jgi:hypothetical protein